jgi:hypothetical protein
MSRILRRPLFRGGSIDSRGTGITSGLTEEPRVRKAVGGAFTGRELMGLNQIYQTVPNLQLNPKSIYTPGTMGGSLDSLFKTMQDPERYDLLGAESLISDTANLSDFYKSQDDEFEPIASIDDNIPIVKKDKNVEPYETFGAEKETKTTDDYEVSGGVAKVKEGETAMDALFRNAGVKKDTGISQGEKDDTEINLEDIFAERIKRAKRGDIADILLGASEGFFEEGTLMGGAKGAVRAGRAPSRTEAAKQAQENVLLQKAFAESKSKAEFEQAVKLLGIKAEDAENLARLYAQLNLKGNKVTDRATALSIINDPNASEIETRAAKEFLGLPISVAAELSKLKGVAGESAARTAASNVYTSKFQGPVDLSNIKEGQTLNEGIYIDTKQRIVIEVDENGKVEVKERY